MAKKMFNKMKGKRLRGGAPDIRKLGAGLEKLVQLVFYIAVICGTMWFAVMVGTGGQ